MKKPPIFSSVRASDRGFALVVTLSLMILLTIIAVGLLTLSSISLRSTTSSSALAEARQNARMAMMLAIGELQKNAGQDQRITATADIAGDAAGLPVAAGAAPLNDKSINGISKGLSTVQPGTRYWTGVWRNSNVTSTAGTEVYTKTPSPQFVQWLISGNETGAAAPITPASGICAVGSDGSVSDPKTAVVLVGRETTGDPTAGNVSRYVAAPLVPINATRGGTSQLVGRYGWWIGDEGVKAKINIPKTNNDPVSYASLAAQRRGWEAVDGFSDYPTPASAGNDALLKVVTLPEAALLVSSANGSTGGATALQAVFHSATTDSRGVLADTLNGGTRIDLTSILSGALPSTNPVSTIPNYPTRNGNIIPRVGTIRSMQAPKWDALKEFYDRSKTLESDSLIVKPAASVTAVSIAPLVTDLRVLLGIKFTPSSTGTGFKATACGKIAVAIANPYSKTLRWKNDLEIELQDQTPAGNRPARIYNLGDSAPFFDRNIASVFNKSFFRIRPAALAPGEARAYTLSGSTLRSVGTGTQRTVIDLAPWTSSAPFDFSRCVELDSSAVYTSFPLLDVRESWQTTLVAMEMRLAGGASSAQPLRRVERFEMDNAYYSDNTRNRNYSYPLDYQVRNKPVPLMCFSFQISQPGVDYMPLMPSGYEMGQRGSTLRSFMDFNLQATRVGKPIASYTPPPYFMESNDGFAQLPDTPPGGDTGMAFTKNLDTSMPWGRGWNGSRNTVLFAVPSQFTSLAQFQHADLTGDDVAASIGHQPGNAFANSYATPFVKRTLAIQPRTDYEIVGSPNPSGVTNYQTNAMGIQNVAQGPRNYYDISYLLNAAVWDSYFLSSIPGSGSPKPENPTLITLNSASTKLTSPVECASELMIDGAFNINCTDKNAWKAFLASSKHFNHKADTGTLATAAFPRSLEQTSPAANPPTGADADSFSGYRRLTDSELDLLATEIVKQVRIRGPFVSLSHFVNRALGDLRRQPALTRCGALQAAIDESGLTISLSGTKKAFSRVNSTTDRLNLSEKNGAPRADMDGGDTTFPFSNADPSTPDWAVTSTDNNYGTVASIIADRAMLNTSKNEQGYRSTGIPGWLTQADVLQVIGPSISCRSDTFRVRAYGESLDSSGKTLAKAYCEVIVQRLPAFVDPSNSPSVRGTALTELNKSYGRQFSIVSFRWLSSQEI